MDLYACYDAVREARNRTKNHSRTPDCGCPVSPQYFSGEERLIHYFFGPFCLFLFFLWTIGIDPSLKDRHSLFLSFGSLNMTSCPGNMAIDPTEFFSVFSRQKVEESPGSHRSTNLERHSSKEREGGKKFYVGRILVKVRIGPTFAVFRICPLDGQHVNISDSHPISAAAHQIWYLIKFGLKNDI